MNHPLLLALFVLAAFHPGLTAPCSAQSPGRWSLDLETGGVWSGYNNVRIPGDTGTRFSLSRDLETDAAPFFRGRFGYRITSRNSISALYAPLTLNADGQFNHPILFQNAVFPAGADIQGTYRFDSYRLTWRYDFLLNETLEAGAGLTGKIRDAAIGLKGAGLSEEKKNTGFVPLINFRLQWRFADRFSTLFEGDALAAPQGRAEDVLLALQYHPASRLRLRLGYRILEGGADNDEVYTFALLHYAVVGATVSF